MKNLLLILIVGLTAFASCKKDDVVNPEEKIIGNEKIAFVDSTAILAECIAPDDGFLNYFSTVYAMPGDINNIGDGFELDLSAIKNVNDGDLTGTYYQIDLSVTGKKGSEVSNVNLLSIKFKDQAIDSKKMTLKNLDEITYQGNNGPVIVALTKAKELFTLNKEKEYTIKKNGEDKVIKACLKLEYCIYKIPK